MTRGEFSVSELTHCDAIAAAIQKSTKFRPSNDCARAQRTTCATSTEQPSAWQPMCAGPGTTPAQMDDEDYAFQALSGATTGCS